MGTIGTIILSILSAVLAALLTNWQVGKKRKDDLVTAILIEAYLAFEGAFGRNMNENPEYKQYEEKWYLQVEDAIAKLQLLGPSSVVARALKVTDNPGSEEFRGDLLKIVRDELRETLGLEKVLEAPRSLRHSKKPSSADS